jgi:hypothetical protein
MGVGPPIIALYRQLRGLGVFDDVKDVVELGAQNVWCPRPELVKSLFKAFDRPPPSQDMLDRFANWKGSALELHEGLGHAYKCIDVDPQFNSIQMDLNFDTCPPEHKSKYDFVTNHGTSEHLINQHNFFKVAHDLTKPGGFMIHAVPFTAHIEHGFFNYQPNFFEALCRYNSYKLYGIWVGPGWQAASLVPWEPDILDYMVINSKTTHLLIALMQKVHSKEFCVPFQGVYESTTPDDVMERYCVVVDGELYDGKRLKHVTKEKVIADEVAKETLQLRNEYASLHGKYWEVMSRLQAAEALIERELTPLKTELAASMLRFSALQEAVRADPQSQQPSMVEDLPSPIATAEETIAGAPGRDLVRELGSRIKRRFMRVLPKT